MTLGKFNIKYIKQDIIFLFNNDTCIGRIEGTKRKREIISDIIILEANKLRSVELKKSEQSALLSLTDFDLESGNNYIRINVN